MNKIIFFLLSPLVLSPSLNAKQIYNFVPPNNLGGYSGIVTENAKTYRFLTYDPWVILDDNAVMQVWAVDSKGQKIKGMTIEAQPADMQARDVVTDSQETENDAPAPQAIESESDDADEAVAMTIPEKEPMRWKRLAAYRGRLGYGLESLGADGGISTYSGSSNIMQYGLTIETLKDTVSDFRVSASYLGHLSTYKTEETVDDNTIADLEEKIRVDRFSFNVEKGVGSIIGLSSQSDLSLGLALRLTSSPIFSDVGDGSGTGFIQTDRFRTVGLILDFRSQVWGHFYRLNSNMHFGILDDDIDVSLFDVEAAYVGTINSSWTWELGLRNESNTMKTDFTCPADKVCDKQANSVRTEIGLFLGISSYISVPDFEG